MSNASQDITVGVSGQDPWTRLPPSSIEAEMCALASLLLAGDDRVLFAQTRAGLSAQAFYQVDHQTIFESICRVYDEKGTVDAVLLAEDLKQRQLLEEVGGVAYIAKILNSVPSAAHGPHYAGIVLTTARQRAGIRIANELLRLMYDPRGLQPTAILHRAASALSKAAAAGSVLDFWQPGDAAEQLLEALQSGDAEGVCCGIGPFDDRFHGLFSRGGYTIVAGRPSMGKSTMIRSLLRAMSAIGHRVGLIAVEERKRKIAGNYLADLANIDNDRIASGRLTGEEWGRIPPAIAQLRRLPMTCTDAALTLPDVMAAFDLLAVQHQCSVIAVDHIHLLFEEGSRDSRHVELTHISAALKAAIKRHNVVGVVAAQLNRPDGVRYPPPPTMRDLRDCGALEEHADSVVLLHRDDYYHLGESGYTPDGLCSAIVGKNRNGRRGVVKLRAELQYQRFSVVEDDPAEPAVPFEE